MRAQPKIVVTAFFALAIAGCGGDGNGSMTSDVSGVVYFRDATENPVSGATVSVFGTQISTTTDQDGVFTLQNVPNGDNFFVTEYSGTWGIVDYWEVPTETQLGADFGVVPDAEIAAIASALGRTFDEADGGIDVTFYEGAVGGETASISVSSDAPFTFNAADEPVLGPGVIADSDGFGELIFTGIDPSSGPATVTVSGVQGMTTCTMDEADGETYPILAKSITIAYAYCE